METKTPYEMSRAEAEYTVGILDASGYCYASDLAKKIRKHFGIISIKVVR